MFLRIWFLSSRFFALFQIGAWLVSINLHAQFVHVLMPVYNGEPHLSSSIQSVLSQTYHSTRLLIYNDGSRDKSDQTIEEKRKVFPAKIFVNSSITNQGISYARKVLIQQSQLLDPEAFVLWLDSDDHYTDNNFLEQLVAQMEASHAEICLFNFEIEYEDSNQIANAAGLIKEYEKSAEILRVIRESSDQVVNPKDFRRLLEFTTLGWTKGYNQISWPIPDDCPYEDFVYMAALLNANKITALAPEYKPIRYLRRSASITGRRTPATFEAVLRQLKVFADSVEPEKRVLFQREIKLFVTRKIEQYDNLLQDLVRSGNSSFTPEVLKKYRLDAFDLIRFLEESVKVGTELFSTTQEIK